MENQTVKEIDFNGDTLLAIQESETQKIYVGVRWVVDGIGFTRGQSNNQLEKIKNDLVLKQGVRNLVFQNMEGKGSTQEVLCIELDFLPLWLAKISITPKMQKDSPETVNKIIEYQLKAKDVLASAFLKSKHKTRAEMLLEQAQVLLEEVEFWQNRKEAP
jgi:anti-repressor protein